MGSPFLRPTRERSNAVRIDNLSQTYAPNAATAYDAQFSDIVVKAISHSREDCRVQSCAGLTQDDLEEFSNVRPPGVRQNKLTARAVLRRQLSKAVDHEFAPDQWTFRRTAEGKPFLGEECPTVHFNISYTAFTSIVATSIRGPVGVDIEDNWTEFDLPFIASFASPRERAAVSELPVLQQRAAFIRLWVLKEAHVKCSGTGLALDLTKIECDLALISDDAEGHGEPQEGRARSRCWQFSSGARHVTAALVTGTK